MQVWIGHRRGGQGDARFRPFSLWLQAPVGGLVGGFAAVLAVGDLLLLMTAPERSGMQVRPRYDAAAALKPIWPGVAAATPLELPNRFAYAGDFSWLPTALERYAAVVPRR